MKLTTDVVLELAKLKAKISNLEEEEKDLIDRIKKEMHRQKIDSFGPSDCPFQLNYSEFDKSSVSWKDEYKKLAKKFVKGWKKVMNELIEDSKQPSSSLTVDPNALYAHRAYGMKESSRRSK